ncbi:MAG TPA: peptidase M50 [Ruminococcaceae bacterium]|nr:peptidase M50 [Oscillospiraceae bacterium]
MTFKIGGCRITISYLFLAIIALAMSFDRSRAASAGLLCAALHEAAHLAAMKAVGEFPREICFTPFGIDIINGSSIGKSYKHDAVVSLAGPLANLAAVAVCLPVCGKQSFMFVGNAALFLLNILPIVPLDGGQALVFLLCLRMEPAKAEKIVSVISLIFLLPLAIVGFLLLLRSKWNFTLLAAACYLMALLLMKRVR